jgi:Flp pilus assembly protein protease CpaA
MIDIVMAVKLVATLVMVATLLYTMVIDIRDRKIPVKTWIPTLLVMAPLGGFLYVIYWYAYGGAAIGLAAMNVITCGLFLILAGLKWLGGADAILLCIISILYPVTLHFPLLVFGIAVILAAIQGGYVLWIKKDTNYTQPFVVHISIGFVLAVWMAEVGLF